MASDGGSSAPQLPCDFSPKSRRFLALCAQDGRLRIWDTDSKTLRQEYVPSAHLSATCTCITWGPCRTAKEGPQRKKRKSDSAGQPGADLLAMGTAAGSVLIYSSARGALHCTLVGGHSGAVTCVDWHPEDGLLYSGSEDANIVEWDLQTGRVQSKWKADRAAVSSLRVSPDGKLLLSAGRTIKMWDLETKEVYRKFTGHSTAVTTLRFATTRPPDSNGLYFLSGAAHDRLLSVWQVREDGKDRNSVVSFTLTDEPQHIDLMASSTKEEVNRPGLKPPCKKPLAPCCSVQMADCGASPGPVPLLAAALSAGATLLAYGSRLQPALERVDINTSERHVCLSRDVQTGLALTVEGAVTKVKTPVVNARSRVLVPGLPGHRAPVRPPDKRRKGADAKEVSIAERLGEMELAPGAKAPPPSLQTDNFVVLLVQGLESNDSTLLNKVLQTSKETVIRKTVARLPLPSVLPLLEVLTTRLQGHPHMAVLMVRWLKAVLLHHTSYLASLPDLVAQLGVLYHMIESRVKVFHRLTRLNGKLQLLITQVVTNDSSSGSGGVDHTAKLVYEEESSDEDEASGDEGLPHEDSNWEEEEEEDEEMEEEEERRTDEEEEEEEEGRTAPKAGGEDEMEHENESEEE
ncbi:LOW QUALITY PROTEIN: WD repeat-containing protein 43 [Menidia menidia]